MIARRRFLASAAGGALAACSSPLPQDASDSPPMPSYLAGYEDLYARDPRAATKQWFDEARFGLFLHYGVYSQLAHGEAAPREDNPGC